MMISDQDATNTGLCAFAFSCHVYDEMRRALRGGIVFLLHSPKHLYHIA